MICWPGHTAFHLGLQERTGSKDFSGLQGVLSFSFLFSFVFKKGAGGCENWICI